MPSLDSQTSRKKAAVLEEPMWKSPYAFLLPFGWYQSITTSISMLELG